MSDLFETRAKCYERTALRQIRNSNFYLERRRFDNLGKQC